MILMSLKLPRQKRNRQQLFAHLSVDESIWCRVLRWPKWFLKTIQRRRGHKRSSGKVSIDQLSDHELKDIGLTRDYLGASCTDWHASTHYTQAQCEHKALRDLQFDLIRHLPRDT